MKQIISKIKNFKMTPTKKSIAGLALLTSMMIGFNMMSQNVINEHNQLEKQYSDVFSKYFTIDVLKENLNVAVQGKVAFIPSQMLPSESLYYFAFIERLVNKQNIQNFDFNNKKQVNQLFENYLNSNDNNNYAKAFTKMQKKYNDNFSSEELNKVFMAYHDLDEMNNFLISSAQKNHRSSIDEIFWKNHESKYSQDLNVLNQFNEKYLTVDEKNTRDFFLGWKMQLFLLNIFSWSSLLCFFPGYRKKSLGFKKNRQKIHFFERLDKPSKSLLNQIQKEIKEKSTIPELYSKEYIGYSIKNIKELKNMFHYRSQLNEGTANNKKESRHIIDKLFILLPILSTLALFGINFSLVNILELSSVLGVVLFGLNQIKESNTIKEYIIANYSELSKEYSEQILNLLLGKIDATSETQLENSFETKTQIHLEKTIHINDELTNQTFSHEDKTVVLNVKEKEVKYLKNHA